MGKSAKFAKRPRKAAAAVADVEPKSISKSTSAAKPLKSTTPALSKTANKAIAKPQPTTTTAAAEKLGKNEISIDRPDYIDLFSGRKTFQRTVREKVLLKGVPSGTRVVSALGVAAAVQSAKKAASASKKAGKRMENAMDLS